MECFCINKNFNVFMNLIQKLDEYTKEYSLLYSAFLKIISLINYLQNKINKFNSLGHIDTKK